MPTRWDDWTRRDCAFMRFGPLMHREACRVSMVQLGSKIDWDKLKEVNMNSGGKLREPVVQGYIHPSGIET